MNKFQLHDKIIVHDRNNDLHSYMRVGDIFEVLGLSKSDYVLISKDGEDFWYHDECFDLHHRYEKAQEYSSEI